jgi:hypothetical protein
MKTRIYVAPGLSAEASFASWIWDICKELSQKGEFTLNDVCKELAREQNSDCPEGELIAQIPEEKRGRISALLGMYLVGGYATNRVEKEKAEGEDRVAKVFFKMTGLYK